MKPNFLDYKLNELFELLSLWMNEHPEQRRHWTLSPFNKVSYKIHMTWVFGDGQMAGLDPAAICLEEAIWLALVAHKEWSTMYNRKIDVSHGR